MYDSGFSIGALIFTRLPSITPTTPGNPPSALKLSIVSLNWVPACLLWEEIRIISNKRDVFMMTEIREQGILPFGHLMYWFLKTSTLSVMRRTTLETLLYEH